MKRFRACLLRTDGTSGSGTALVSICRKLATCRGKSVNISCAAKRLSMTGPGSTHLVPDVHSEAEVSCWHPRWQLKNAYETTMTSLPVHGCHDTAATSGWCLDIHSKKLLIHDKLTGMDADEARSGQAKLSSWQLRCHRVGTSDQQATSMKVLHVP